ENGDGVIKPSEVRDLAFVAAGECSPGCSNAIYIVDLRGLQRPQEIGHIDMPGSVFKLDIDADKKRLFATGYYNGTDSRPALFMIDVSNPTAFAADADSDGIDDRIVWRHAFDAPTSWVNMPRLDKERGLLYVPTAGALSSRTGPLQVWAIYDNCCDLAVDFTAEVHQAAAGDRESLLRKEKEALQTGIGIGLDKAAANCGLSVSTISILEQGSGACLWRGKCDDNYQPGLSDHDFEVFLRDADYDTPVGSETIATCTVREMNDVFRDSKTGDPKEIAVPSGGKMSFDDITFFPEVRERFETARFDVERPTSGGSDAVGDMGLGRRSLLLKWVLEGAYVTGVPGRNVAGRSLDAILTDLKNVTGIPQLEGYEWSVLQDFALAKSKAYVRIKGAADPASAFHKLFVKQLHDAGKAGIRTTMARLVADPDGNRAVLDITRDRYENDACVAVDPAVTNPRAWPSKGCSSFEEYVASVAARMLQDGRPLFTFDDVANRAHRFFRVKSDRERIISEQAADVFITQVAQFISQARVLTQPVYAAQLPSDPDVTLRTGNMTFAGVELGKALAKSKIPLSPRVFNQGFRNGSGLQVTMYRTDAEGTGTEVTSTRVDLNGGEERFLAFQRNADGTLALDNGKAKPIFTLDVDLPASGFAPHGVSFLIDVPERTMKEANRENNLGGFFYYVLDRGTGTTPSAPAAPYFPVANRTELLKPSLECFDSPTLQITQRLMIGGELIGDQAILGRGEAVTITLSVTNYSGETVTGAMACSNITNQCYTIGSPIPPGGTGSVTVNYVTPNADTYIDGTPSLFSPQTGVQAGAVTRLIVNGSAYTIEPMMDEAVVKDIDPELLNVEAGGTVHRHYRVIGTRSGLPKPNLTVTGELEGFYGSTVQKRPFTFKTNNFGEICVPASGGVCTDDERSIDVPYDPAWITPTTYTMTLKQIDGLDIPASNHTAFSFDAKDRGWSQNYAVGGSIGGGVKIVAGPGMEVEDGFE
ncbi:MAG TPA: Ig-like domain-containing protein, partial [Vicinamibacterales bacterium]